MLRRFRVLSLSAAAALFVASSVSSAPHDGPGEGCVTHHGVTYISGGRVYSEGSGGCNSSADPEQRHDISHSIQERRFWGWNGIGTRSQTGLTAPFAVWLPINRALNCPRNYRGHVDHYAPGIDRNERYTNTASC